MRISDWSSDVCSSDLLSSAPMSTRAPGERTTSAPMAILARNGGSNRGSSSGDGNGKAGGVTGCGLPADTSGLAAAGRSWCWAMLANIGLPPLSVPVHSCGTSCADDCTQLLEPATLRPSVQGSRLCGPQYGVDMLLAGFSRTMAGELPAGAW